MITAYKVVQALDGKLVSPLVKGSARVEYRPGEEITGPGGSPLFVWCTRKAALAYVDIALGVKNKSAEVWKVEAEPTKDPQKRRISQYIPDDLGEVLAFYSDPTAPSAPLPRGCRAAEKVRLVEKIYQGGE